MSWSGPRRLGLRAGLGREGWVPVCLPRTICRVAEILAHGIHPLHSVYIVIYPDSLGLYSRDFFFLVIFYTPSIRDFQRDGGIYLERSALDVAGGLTTCCSGNFFFFVFFLLFHPFPPSKRAREIVANEGLPACIAKPVPTIIRINSEMSP